MGRAVSRLHGLGKKGVHSALRTVEADVEDIVDITTFWYMAVTLRLRDVQAKIMTSLQRLYNAASATTAGKV